MNLTTFQDIKYKKSDARYTPPEYFVEAKRHTGINWRRAKDMAPKNAKVDSLSRPWNGRVFVNPPFSQSKIWAEYLLDQIKKGDVTSALLILPWYSFENVASRVVPRPKWMHRWLRRARPFLKTKWWSDTKFIKPNGVQYKHAKKVYSFFLVKFKN
jgi:hypothetical protein